AQVLMPIFKLLLHPKTHRARLAEHGKADSRGVRAMRGPEGIIDIDVAEFRESTGELWVVRFLPGMKTQIFQERDVAVLHRGDDLFRHLANYVVTEDDRLIDQGVQMIADWSERVFLDTFSLRPAEVRHQNRLRLLLAQIIDCRQRFPNSCVVGDFNFVAVLFDRHIEINARQNALPANIDISDRKFRHYLPSISSISTQRLL